MTTKPLPIFLDVVEKFNPGDPAPCGYMAWHDWAAVQYRAGMRQRKCSACGRLGFPQEFTDDGKHADGRCLAALRKDGGK